MPDLEERKPRRRKSKVPGMVRGAHLLWMSFEVLNEEDDYRDWARRELEDLGIPLRARDDVETFCLYNHLKTIEASDLPMYSDTSRPLPRESYDPPEVPVVKPPPPQEPPPQAQPMSHRTLEQIRE